MMEVLNAVEFRQRLAGLADVAGGQDELPDMFRDLASDYVLLLAMVFNRKRLDAKTIWTRIDSAIQSGLAECDGEDIERFCDVGFNHVQATPNVVACHGGALDIQQQLYSLDEESRVCFLQYLSRHRYPAIVFGRQKWEERKTELQRVADELGATADEKGGEQ